MWWIRVDRWVRVRVKKLVDLTESIFLYLRYLRFSEGIVFSFTYFLSVRTPAQKRSRVERVECCFALLPTTDERTNELSERKEKAKNKMLQGQRLRHIPVYDSGWLGQGGRAGQHVLYRAQQAAVGARITTQQQRQHQQENLAKPSVRGNIALVALIVPVLLVVIGAGIWWWWRRRTRRFGKGEGGGDR